MIVPTLVFDSYLMLEPIFVAVLMPSLELILTLQKCVSVVYDHCIKEIFYHKGNNETYKH